MEEFSICCTTCNSRLRVRDESLIGQILSCPKCNAMVMVQRQETQVAVGSAGVDSQALTQDAIESPPADSANPHEFEDRQDLETKHVRAFEADPDETQSPPMQADWQSPQTSRYRQVAMIVSVAVFAIVSAVALFGLFIKSSLEDKRVADAVTDAGASEEVREDASADASGQPSEDLPNSDPGPSADGQPVESNDNEDSSTEEGVTPEAPDGAKPNAEDATSEAGTVADAADSAGERTMRPIDANPEMANPLVGPNPERIFEEPGDDEPKEEDKPEDLPDGLAGFRGIFSEDGFDPAKLKRKKKVQQLVQFDGPPIRSDEYPTPRGPVDVQAQLARRLPGLDVRAHGFSDLIGFMADSSDIPMIVNVQSLDSAGIEPNAPLTGRYVDTTFGSALEKMTQSVGCRANPMAGGFLMIEAADEKTAAFLAAALSVEDLLTGDAGDEAVLIGLLTRIAGAPAETLSIDAAAKVLQFEGDSAMRFQLALSLDALRIARGLARKIPERFASRWLAEDKPAVWQTPREQKIQLSGAQALPIGNWVRQAARSQNAAGMIDWLNAWGNGLSTSSKVLPWTRGATIDSFTSEVLEAHGLQYFDIGYGSWVVTTQHAMSLTISIVTYSEAIRGDQQEFMNRFSQSLGLASVDELDAIVDPVSQRLVCRLPRYVLKQVPKLFEAGE